MFRKLWEWLSPTVDNYEVSVDGVRYVLVFPETFRGRIMCSILVLIGKAAIVYSPKDKVE